jgi:hypothetical protein
MRYTIKQIRTLIEFTGICLLCVLQSLAGSAKSGQGNLTVTPTSVNAGSTNSFFFRFRTSKNSFNLGSQATLVIPAGWSAPQINDASGPGFVKVTPVLSGSTVSIDDISGSGPWTLALSFSTSKNQAGFSIDYSKAIAPVNAGIYQFTAQSRQSGGLLKALKSGSPSVTVTSLAKTDSTVSVGSGLNPSSYGDLVTFTAAVAGADSRTVTGTVTFKDGDMVLSAISLDGQGQASFTTNRFSVPDSPSWITAEYGGDLNFNMSVSTVLLQDVSPAPLTLSGLTAKNKIYDGTTDAVLDPSNVNLSGVLATDDVTLDMSSIVGSFADQNAGTEKDVHVSGLALAGVDSGNYLLSPTTTLSATIFPTRLTVIANDTNRLFGASNPAFTATYSGFVAAEDSLVLSGSPAFSTPADPMSSAADSPYPIVVSNGTLTATNYSFVFVAGRLTITPGSSQTQRINSIVKLLDSSFIIACSGAAGQTYLLQAASDPLKDSWTTVGTNVADINGLITFKDSPATNLQSRFYRITYP